MNVTENNEIEAKNDNENNNDDANCINNKIEINSNDDLFKSFNCVKCSIKLKDVKLLKTHYWKVHIWKNEVIKANDKLNCLEINKNTLNNNNNNDNDNNEQKRKLNAKSKNNNVEISAKKRKLNGKNKTILNDENQEQEGSNQEKKDEMEVEDVKANLNGDEVNELEKLTSKLENLSEDELNYFNLEGVDEKEILERTKSLYPNNYFDKYSGFVKGSIAWAQWTFKSNVIMWPCIIEKSNKDSSKKFGKDYKIFLKYYEADDRKRNTFKLVPSKVEPFFRTENHFDFKKQTAAVKSLQNEFFKCYTSAVKDYLKLLEENEKNRESDFNDFSENQLENASISGLLSKSAKKVESTLSKYLVNGKMITLDEVKEKAEKPISEKQIQINKERLDFSNKLVDILLTKDCEDFLVSIFTGKIDCKRHHTYLEADLITRRKMKFSSPGPLVEDDQKKLASFINEISNNQYVDKPANLNNYEYDVLYPEAVIWGLQKLESITFKKAEQKYKQSFKRTEEEKVKQRCNEILNNLSGLDKTNLSGSNNDNEEKSKSQNETITDSNFQETNTKTSYLEATCMDEDESFESLSKLDESKDKKQGETEKNEFEEFDIVQKDLNLEL